MGLSHVLNSLLCLVLVTTLGLLGTQLEVFSPFQSQMFLCLASLAFQTKHNLTCGLCLLVKDGLRLTTETHLFGIVTTLSLGEVRGLSRLVLGYFVDLVLAAFFAGTKSFAFFGHVDHFDKLEGGC